jgi:hypothetical protein
MSDRQVLWMLYILQALFISAVFTGGITRGEISFWPSEISFSWYTALNIYVRLIFYSVFFVLPYALLAMAYPNYNSGTEVPFHFVVISAWVLITVCLFHETIFGFIGDLGEDFSEFTPAWYQWLHILWVAFTVCVIIWWRSLSKEKFEARVQERLDEQAELYRRWQEQTKQGE